MRKVGSPTGNVTFEIRLVSDDSLIVDKLWGQAEDLPTEDTWEEVEFETPPTVNAEVRILVYSPGHIYGDHVSQRYQSTDVKADEYNTYGDLGDWDNKTAQDCAYRYTYTEEAPAAGGGPAALVAAGII